MATSALLALIRPWLAGRPGPQICPAAAEAAQAHRLGGWLHHLGAPLPHPWREIFQRRWAHNLAGHLRRLDVLRAVWPEGAPPPLLFKGADLSERVYRDPGARRANDLDLLVEAIHAPAIHRALARHTAPQPSGHERHRAEAPHAVGYAIDGVLLEVHTAPLPSHRANVDLTGLFARATPAELDGFAVRHPHPHDRATLWLTNRVKDAFYGDLADALDGALLLRALGSGCARWRARVDGAGLRQARRLAEAQLTALGLWQSPTAGPWFSPLVPTPPDGRGAMPGWAHRQLLKWMLAEPKQRRATALRALSRPCFRDR